MCLFTNQICPLRACKDIVCYKRFELIPRTELMKTTIRGTQVCIPTTYKPTVMVAHPNWIERVGNTLEGGARFRIYGGMIHAYTKLEYSKGPWPFAIFKCIIPKGTLYYKGTSGDICAKKMLVVEQVK